MEEEKENNEKPKTKKKKKTIKEITDDNVEIVDNSQTQRTPKRKIIKDQRVTRSNKKKQVKIVQELKEETQTNNIRNKKPKTKETEANACIENLDSTPVQTKNIKDEIKKKQRTKKKVESAMDVIEKKSEESNVDQTPLETSELKKKSATKSKKSKTQSSKVNNKNRKAILDNQGLIESDKKSDDEIKLTSNTSSKNTPILNRSNNKNSDGDFEEKEFELKLDNDDEQVLDNNVPNQDQNKIDNVDNYTENQSQKKQFNDKLEQQIELLDNINQEQKESLLTDDDDDDDDDDGDLKKSLSHNHSNDQKFKSSNLNNEHADITEDKSSINNVDSTAPILNSNNEPNVTKDILNNTFDKSTIQSDSKNNATEQLAKHAANDIPLISSALVNSIMPCTTFYNTCQHQENISKSDENPTNNTLKEKAFDSVIDENPQPKKGARIVKPKQILNSSSISAKQHNILSDVDCSKDNSSETKKFVVEIGE
jgi:hypothetical protein